MDTTTPWARLDTEDPPRAVMLTSALSPDEGFIRPLPDDTGDWLAASSLVVVGAPLIAHSARKHDIHDDDMLHAFNHPILVEDLDDGLVMFVGADTAGNLLGIGVIDSTDARSSSTP